MKQEEKDLLLKDLCARLPYGVRMFEIEPINDIQSHLTLYSITNKKSVICITPSGGIVSSSIDAFKPYLFPLSSMTEEQREEINKITNGSVAISKHFFYDLCNCSKIYHFDVIAVIDWLNANRFDYRGLIPKGLAIDCTNLNIY